MSVENGNFGNNPEENFRKIERFVKWLDCSDTPIAFEISQALVAAVKMRNTVNIGLHGRSELFIDSVDLKPLTSAACQFDCVLDGLMR